MNGVGKREKCAKTRKEKALKVVYISSPMKVKTSASKFRALVQELTGRESDVARLMDGNCFDDGSRRDRGRDADHGFKCVDDHLPLYVQDNMAVTTEEDHSPMFFEPFHDVFRPQTTEENFTGLVFPSGFLYESSQADFLTSIDLL